MFTNHIITYLYHVVDGFPKRQDTLTVNIIKCLAQDLCTLTTGVRLSLATCLLIAWHIYTITQETLYSLITVIKDKTLERQVAT